jgi:Mg2+/Co2+ transporter CorB
MVPILETSLVVIVIMMAMSAFFSGSETALTAANRSRIHHLELEDNKRARLVARLMEDREHLIGAILLGNNMVNIFASTLAGYAFSQTFGQAGVVYATVVMTALVVIFAEVMPKTYAIRRPETFALAVAPTMTVLVRVLAPVTSAVQWLVVSMLGLIGVRHGEDGAPSEEEIRGALALYKHEGGLVKDEHDMLDSILDLGQVEVGEVMTHRRSVVTVDVDAPVDDVIDEILASPYTRIPLWRGEPDNIIGVLHAKNLLRELRRSEGRTKGLEIVSIASDPWFVPDTTLLSEQLAQFRERHAHFALVVDEYGTLMGVVTMEDILEEIVGEIEDEYDEDIHDLAISEDGSVVVEGTATIRDINREFDWNLPDEEANTIAGLVIHEARQIPEIGQTFVFYNFRFEVTGRQRNQITELRITPLEDDDNNGEMSA